MDFSSDLILYCLCGPLNTFLDYRFELPHNNVFLFLKIFFISLKSVDPDTLLRSVEFTKGLTAYKSLKGSHSKKVR